ncbi:hypothetical protein CEF21_15210 [Bacillus sp. FJAT-42376]|uniref:hypothetical protein n=1 Tax=Bacillus sp. FJAT-42376 TaxID=2014076 RepID=UPI000F50C438|nr:hypothetical protein [Bacillus sp. FJAT-42376]AZB43541.1 hypothetical protein CEF21_15210 [Bacillus sp. FJAT-42376]
MDEEIWIHLYTILQWTLAAGVYLLIPAIILIKALKKKQYPRSSLYTPFDNIIEGKVSSEKLTAEQIREDDRHKNRYGEID